MNNKTLLAIAIAFASTTAFAGPQATPATRATPAVPATPRVSPAIRAVPAVPAVQPMRTDVDASATQSAQSRALEVQSKTKTKVGVDVDTPRGHTQTNAAQQGALHGVKGSAGATIGMTANDRGDFDFNADGTISQDENVASNRINAAINQGVAGPLFKEIDTNGDNILSAEEMSYYHVSLGKAPISLGLTANTLGQFDFDGDGTITQAEIDASVRVNDAVEAGIDSSTFIAIDTNRNGVLSAEELQAFAASQ